LIYAWHPLAVWEFAGSGHIDPLAFAFIALALLARRRNWETATVNRAWAGDADKIIPIVFVPAALQTVGMEDARGAGPTIVIGYCLILDGSAGSAWFIPGYAQERGLLVANNFFILVW